jgi:hypothetical protein
MKLNEFKQVEQLEERLSDYVGNFGSAALKRISGQTDGKSLKAQMVKDIFLKDFIDDAVSSLESAIKGGLVDPNLNTRQKVDPNTVKPQQAPQAQPAKGQAPKKVSPADKRQTQQNLNDYVKKVAQTINNTVDIKKKMQLTKEIVNYMADRKDYPEWDNALATVQRVIKSTDLDPGFANSAVNRLKSGNTMSESLRIYYINQLLESVGFSWEEIGLEVITEGTTLRIVESNYTETNALFESILNESQSIGNYLANWFSQYMQGIDYASNQAAVDKAIANIENTYDTDRGKNALATLAQLAWAVSKGSAPGAADAMQDLQSQQTAQSPQAKPQGQQSAPQQASKAPLDKKQIVSAISDNLTQLAKLDPALHKQLIQQLALKAGASNATNQKNS